MNDTTTIEQKLDDIITLLTAMNTTLTKIESDFRKSGSDSSELEQINARFKEHNYTERLKI